MPPLVPKYVHNCEPLRRDSECLSHAGPAEKDYTQAPLQAQLDLTLQA